MTALKSAGNGSVRRVSIELILSFPGRNQSILTINRLVRMFHRNLSRDILQESAKLEFRGSATTTTTSAGWTLTSSCLEATGAGSTPGTTAGRDVWTWCRSTPSRSMTGSRDLWTVKPRVALPCPPGPDNQSIDNCSQRALLLDLGPSL